MPAKFISSAFEAATTAPSSSKKNSRKPDWMKQHRSRPNMPNKENTDNFIDQLQSELEAAKVRLHSSSIVDFTQKEEILLQNIREKRNQVKYDLELAQEDVEDLKYDRQTMKLDLEAVQAQLEELVLHESSLKSLIDQSSGMNQEELDAISAYQSMVDMQQQHQVEEQEQEEPDQIRVGAVSATPSSFSNGDQEEEDYSLRALGQKTASILQEFSQEYSSYSSSSHANQFGYGLTWSNSAGIEDTTTTSGVFNNGDEEPNTDFVHPTFNQFANAQRLTAFYLRYAPEKVIKVWEALHMYAGREETLFEELEAHYCPEGLCSSLQHYKKEAAKVEQSKKEESSHEFFTEADPYNAFSTTDSSIYYSCPAEEDASPTPGPNTSSVAPSEVLLHKEPELYQPSHGLSLNSRQQRAQAALPEVALQIHALQLNVKGLKNAIDSMNREIKQMNSKINSLQVEKKRLEKESGALYYKYAGPSEASRKREKSRIEYLESRIAKTAATFEEEHASWEEWVKEAQAAYRQRHNLSEDVGLAYPGMAPVLVSRGSLKEAVEMRPQTQNYLSAPPAGLSSNKNRKKASKKGGSNDDLYDDECWTSTTVAGVEGMAAFF